MISPKDIYTAQRPGPVPDTLIVRTGVELQYEQLASSRQMDFDVIKYITDKGKRAIWHKLYGDIAEEVGRLKLLCGQNALMFNFYNEVMERINSLEQKLNYDYAQRKDTEQSGVGEGAGPQSSDAICAPAKVSARSGTTATLAATTTSPNERHHSSHDRRAT
jgi:hypothetical protein